MTLQQASGRFVSAEPFTPTHAGIRSFNFLLFPAQGASNRIESIEPRFSDKMSDRCTSGYSYNQKFMLLCCSWKGMEFGETPPLTRGFLANGMGRTLVASHPIWAIGQADKSFSEFPP